MTDDSWDISRVERLRAGMTDAEIEVLRAREKSDPQSLTLDELGILFIITRERIRALEAKAKASRGDKSEQVQRVV